MTGLICLALLATSCRRLPYAPPTVKPTITPTPRSTALPPIPTPVPLGSTKNPLHIVFVAPQNPAAQTSDSSATEEPTAAQAASDLEKALLDAAQMTVSVDVVASNAEALSALCASPKGTISAAWLDGLAYAAAFAQECGSAALEIGRGSGSDTSTGDQARIITSSADINAVADLEKHTFCRLGYSDAYSWLIPSLMIHAAGLADSDLKAINDYTDADVMLNDVAAGKCDAAGISGNLFDDIVNSGARSSVRFVQSSVAFPYIVLVMPPQLPLAQQQQLSAALIAIGNGSRADTLKPLLAQDEVVEANDDQFGNLRSFIGGAGIDLAQAGN